MKKYNWIFFGLILILLFSFFMNGNRSFELIDGSNSNVLILSDTAKTEIEPDKVTVNLRIVTRNESHEEAVNQNTIINNRLIEHFKEDYEVVSRSYRVSEWTKTNQQTWERTRIGYQVYNQIEITSYDVEEAGKIISEAFELGAHEIQSVNYDLTDETKRKIQDELTNEVIKTMQKRADSIAEASGVKIKGIVKINPTSWDYSPMVLRQNDMLMAESKAYDMPIFSPEKREVSSSVTITYRIE